MATARARDLVRAALETDHRDLVSVWRDLQSKRHIPWNYFLRLVREIRREAVLLAGPR